MTIGIYKIINNINNKIYIGQSIHIEQRISEHKSESKLDSPNRLAYNSIIHKAIRKYGWNNFSWEIIEECSIAQLDDRERYWIAYFNSLVPNGYNILIGGQAYRKDNNHINSDTQKDKCPICGKEKYKQAALCLDCYHQQQTIDIITRIQEIDKFDFINQILDSSYEEVASHFGYSSSNGLKKILQKIQYPYIKQQMYDYYYQKMGEYHPKDKRRKKTYRKVIQIDAETFETIDSFSLSPEECKKRELHSGHIYECCIGKRKQYKGYIFRFFNQSIPIFCIDKMDKNAIYYFSSLYQAAKWCKKNGFSKNSSESGIKRQIKEACMDKTKRPTAFGFIWNFS